MEEALEEYTDLSKDLYVNPDRRKEFVKLLKEKGEIRFDNKLLFHIINTTNDYFFNINKLARGEQFASKTIRKKKNGEIIQLSSQAFPVS